MTNVSIITAAALATAVLERASFTRALDAISKVVDHKNGLPILTHVRLFASGPDTVTARGTDLDIEIDVAIVGGPIDSRFDVTVPAKKLTELAKKGKASSFVTISAPPARFADDADVPERDRCAVVMTASIGGTDYKLDGTESVKFPVNRHLDFSGAAYSMSGSTLFSAIDSVRGAISTEATRYYLNGIFLHLQDRELNFAATDGHRLYRQRFDAPEGVRSLPSIIIPHKTANLMHGLMKGRDCPTCVEIVQTEKGVAFSFGSISIRSRVIDGTFPDYQRCIPSVFTSEAKVDSASMLDAIKSVRLIAEGNQGARLALAADQIVVSMSAAGTGSAATTVESSFVGDDFEVGINAAYLAAAIEITCPAEERLTMQFGDNGSPVVLRGDSPRFIAVVMPTRI